MSGVVEEFARALEGVGGRAVRAASWVEAVDEVRRIAGERPAVVDGWPELKEVEAGLAAVDDPWKAEVGITSGLVAAAETGTIVIASGPETPRSTSLVPPMHVALVSESHLVSTYAEAVERVAAMRPIPSAVTFITGPSSSGDIELTLVRGVHGPAELHVVFFPESEPSGRGG